MGATMRKRITYAGAVQHVGLTSAQTLARQSGLKLSGFRHRLWRLGISAQREAIRTGGMSVQDVAAALGVDLSTVYRWTTRGWLRPTYGYALTAKHYSFSAEDVSTFLATIGGLIPALRPIPIWREEVEAARAALEARYINGVAIMRLMVRPPQQLAWLRRKHGFPGASLRIGAVGDFYDRAQVRGWLAAHPLWATKALEEAVRE
jgi:hypothetical protein